MLLCLLNHNYIHLLWLLHLMLLLLPQTSFLLVLFVHVILYLYFSLSNLLCNLSHFSLYSRCLLHFHLFQLLTYPYLHYHTCIHLLWLLHLQMPPHPQMSCFQLLFVHVILCLYLSPNSLLCNLDHYVLYSKYWLYSLQFQSL